MMKRALWLLVSLIVLGALALGGWTYVGVEQPYQGHQGEQFVDIQPGTSRAAIGRSLVQAGVVKSELAFRVAVWMRGAGPSFDRPPRTREQPRRIRQREPDAPLAVIDAERPHGNQRTTVASSHGKQAQSTIVIRWPRKNTENTDCFNSGSSLSVSVRVFRGPNSRVPDL